MALSSCPKCNGHSFEVKTIEPSGGNYKENAVQCRSCGVVVGVVGYYNPGALLKEQEKEITKLQRGQQQILSALHTINSNLEVLERLIKRM
jgi:hypothetical protein